MKSFLENRVVIQVSLEKPQCFLIFLEETLCWPVPPRLPAHVSSPCPLTDTLPTAPGIFIEHSRGIFSAIHPPAGRPSTSGPTSPTLASLL